MMNILTNCLIVINVISFVTYGIDKYRAIHKKWRIKESILLGLAFVGGPLGAFLGMEIFRHKTKHHKFMICIPLSLIVWCAGIVYFIMK